MPFRTWVTVSSLYSGTKEKSEDCNVDYNVLPQHSAANPKFPDTEYDLFFLNLPLKNKL